LVSADSFDGRRRPLGSGMNGSSEVTREDCQPWVISHPDLCGEVRRKPDTGVDIVVPELVDARAKTGVFWVHRSMLTRRPPHFRRRNRADWPIRKSQAFGVVVAGG